MTWSLTHSRGPPQVAQRSRSPRSGWAVAQRSWSKTPCRLRIRALLPLIDLSTLTKAPARSSARPCHPPIVRGDTEPCPEGNRGQAVDDNRRNDGDQRGRVGIGDDIARRVEDDVDEQQQAYAPSRRSRRRAASATATPPGGTRVGVMLAGLACGIGPG